MLGATPAHTQTEMNADRQTNKDRWFRIREGSHEVSDAPTAVAFA